MDEHAHTSVAAMWWCAICCKGGYNTQICEHLEQRRAIDFEVVNYYATPVPGDMAQVPPTDTR
jgi:hypothetical protein